MKTYIRAREGVLKKYSAAAVHTPLTRARALLVSNRKIIRKKTGGEKKQGQRIPSPPVVHLYVYTTRSTCIQCTYYVAVYRACT